jgi:hypothetical protein
MGPAAVTAEGADACPTGHFRIYCRNTRRRKMAERRNRLTPRRRVIFNDDGDERYSAAMAEELLAGRFSSVLNSDVNTYMWCPHVCLEPGSQPGLDAAEQIILDAARKHGMEAWVTMRMNDTHASHWPAETFNHPPDVEVVEVDWEANGLADAPEEAKRFYRTARPFRLKQTHPETLVGEQRMRWNFDLAPRASIMHMNWSAFDYAHPLVRDFVLGKVEHFCRNYDWDGLELDFLRMPVFFKPGQVRENIPTMTAFVRRVRELLDAIGAERGRPYPLAVHVPDAPKYCLRCGLDIETWLSEGLVDLVVMSTGYRPNAQMYGDFIDLCHSHGAGACVCMNCGVIAPDCTFDGRHVVERFRAWITSAWLEDVDGIELFNLFGTSMIGDEAGPLDELHLVGDPTKMIGLDKLYESCSRGVWVDREILADPADRPRVVDEQPILVKVGDPVEVLAREGRIRELRLEVRVSQLHEEEWVQVWLNDERVEITERRKETREEGPVVGPYQLKGGGYWFEAVVGAPPVRQGANYVTVIPGPGCVGSAASHVENVQLWVRYNKAD